ncbi:RNA methyltransferase [Arcanobacterium haemolyticum]|nr:RNA methyltransferase [Arcanobacterium haemolyticum]
MALRIKEATRSQIARAARLHRREQRTKFQQMLVEGPQAVREVFAYAPELVRDLFATEDALERYPEIRDLASSHQTWTHMVSTDDFRDLSVDAQGLLVVANMPEKLSLDSVLNSTTLAVATVAINDPGNVGTIIRTADAAGAGAVLMAKGSAETTAPKVIRSTAGSLFHLPVLSGLDVREIIDGAHHAGFQVLAADAAGEWELAALVEASAQRRLLGARIDGPDLSRPTMWLLGNEAHGFDRVDISAVDATVSIPIFGKAESLNVAIAGALGMYMTALSRTTTEG